MKRKFRLAIAKFFRKLKQSRSLLAIMNLKKDSNREDNKDVLYDHILQ